MCVRACVVLLTDNERDMRCMVVRLEKYLEERKLELNVRKTKVFRFRKGAGRFKKYD